MKPRILLGAGKGRLLPVLDTFLAGLGLDPRHRGRRLVYEFDTERYTLKVAHLRWEDINNNHNRFDMITYGADQWLESGRRSMIGLRYYPQGDCRLSLLVPEAMTGRPIAEIVATCRVATSYPSLAREYLGLPEERVVKMTGSVETAVGLGWAECVFDVIESGETARANDLLEVKECVRFGAVLATCKPEKIPLFVELGLIPPPRDAVAIAFDGTDGTNKVTVARHLVHCGLWSERPAVLVAPFTAKVPSVEVGRTIGRKHYRAPRQVTAVYERSLLSCLAELLDAGCGAEQLLSVAEAWRPWPELTFLCRVYRGGGDLYDDAAAFARDRLGLRVRDLDTSGPIERTLERVKAALREEGLLP